MAGVRYVTRATIAVLKMLVEADGHRVYPAAVSRQVRDSQHTVQRVLIRLTEDGHTTAAGEGRFKLYTLTPEGAVWARQLLAEDALPPPERRQARLSRAEEAVPAQVPPLIYSGSGR